MRDRDYNNLIGLYENINQLNALKNFISNGKPLDILKYDGTIDCDKVEKIISNVLGHGIDLYKISVFVDIMLYDMEDDEFNDLTEDKLIRLYCDYNEQLEDIRQSIAHERP